MFRLIVKLAAVVFALLLAARVVPGITVDGLEAALIAALVLGIVNILVRPILLVLTFPITLLTLGLFVLVLNGLMLWLVANVVPGFTVAGFMPAFLAALIVSVVSAIVNRVA